MYIHVSKNTVTLYMQDMERTSKPSGNQIKGNGCSTHAYVATAVINFNVLNDLKKLSVLKRDQRSKSTQ